LEVLGPDGHRNPGKLLDASYIPAIVIADRLVPIHVAHLSPTREVYDLGKNGSGWPEITVTGHAGDVVRILPGELLNPDGTVTQVSGGADPQDPVLFTYTLAGRGVEQWNPRFSYYGFRYVQIDLIPAAGHAPPEVLDLRGDFTHADVSLDGQFVSDNHLLNSIHDLIDRAILSNLSSVITDCPTREKLGWLEQTHLAGRSIMYNYGVHRLYEKMSQDMAEAQLKNGFVPAIAPEYVAFVDSKGKSTDFRDSPEWGSAVVLSPWEAYQFYGDRRLLEQHYDSMLRYVGYLHARLTNGILAYGLGDWYDIGPEPPGKSQLTSSGVTATAIYYEDLEVLAKIASLIGHPGDQIRFQQEATSTKRAFNNRFLHRDSGVYDLGSQTAQAMPLALGLVPAEERDRTLKRLVDDIRTHGNHVTAGDIGFHYLVRALTDAGRSDVLMDMFSQTDSPSYGYQLRQGATTLTEAWDARRYSSQNHFMLGHGEEWFYRGLAGIDLDFSRVPSRRLLIRPSFVRGVTQCLGSLQSVLGEISSSWGIHGSKLDLKIDVPVGVGAVVVLPSTTTNASLDGKRVSGAEIPIGSGHFHVQAMVQ
jgi:alpha-L-rhamnosidase